MDVPQIVIIFRDRKHLKILRIPHLLDQNFQLKDWFALPLLIGSDFVPGSTWYEVNAGHFLQDTCDAEIAAHVLLNRKN